MNPRATSNEVSNLHSSFALPMGSQRYLRFPREGEEERIGGQSSCVDHRALSGQPVVQLKTNRISQGVIHVLSCCQSRWPPTCFRALWSRRTRGLPTRNDGGGWHPSYGGHSCSNRAAIAADFFRQEPGENFALELVCRYVSRLCSVTATGPFRRPAALGLLLRVPRPFGVTVPPKTSLQPAAQNAAQTSFGPPPRMQPFGLGNRAHSLGSARCDPIKIGKFNKRRQSCTRTK